VRPARVANLRSLNRLALVAVVAGGILWLSTHNAIFQPAVLERALKRFGRWSPIPFILVYALGKVLFLPGSLLTVAGGALFGPFWGTGWNLIGATLGAIIAFAIARYLASDWVARSAGERLQALANGVEEEGWRFVAFVRLVPLFPFNLVNYALGLTRIGLVEYAVASVVCMTPGAVAYTYVGYAGLQAASGQAGAIRNGLLALAMVAAVAYIPRLARRLKAARDADAASC
jgi:uncharacterized membrane protein YdjX (TVP38/TMEM64 family)